jgi:hypothetical protein
MVVLWLQKEPKIYVGNAMVANQKKKSLPLTGVKIWSLSL